MDLREQRNRFVAFAFASADLLVECDLTGVVQFAMGAGQRLLGQAPESLPGHSVLLPFSGPDAQSLATALRSVATGQRFGPLRLRATAAPPGVMTLVQGCRLPDQADRVFLSFAEGREEAPASPAGPGRDGATGLLDREGFAASTADALARARAAGQDVRLTLVSLPDFEAFEARAGTEGTRSFLAQVGTLLRTLALDDCSAALGDGKFGLLQDSASDLAGLKADMGALARKNDPTGQGVAVDGAQVAPEPGMGAADAARALLYTVSRFAEGAQSGAGGSLTEDLAAMAAQSTSRIARIRQGLDLAHLNVAAQPIVEMTSRAIKHHELLVRLDGSQSPLEDIVFAERTGLIFDLDHAMCHFALRHLSSPAGAEMAVAVNLSGLSVTHDPFLERLLALLRPAASLAPRLAFEITETTAISDLVRANTALQELRRLGFRVCLDDFGAGAASFQYLRQLDIDYIKIDGAYVRTVLSAPREAAILRAIVGLARDLKAGVIAEQIETPQQAQSLRALGCGYGQGYLFGRPVPLASPAQPLEIAVARRPVRPTGT